jgi:hypothetical protein
MKSSMFGFQIFRTFQPFQNPMGFGASDFIELAFTILLVVSAFFWRPWIEPYFFKLAYRPGWSMLALAVLPIALRLLLLPGHPVPSPSVSDEFSHLLNADTLLHFRMANPPHPLHKFFETLDVLQEPAYSSIYAIGQGAALAFGRLIFGHPWAGVVLSIAVLCSLCYWMLRAWTTAGWAFAGALMAVFQFGPLNQWMNSYWGGAVSATAGCLVFGSLPRLRTSARMRDAALLGLGIAIQLLTRPYESILLVGCVLLYFAPVLWQSEEVRRLLRTAPVVIAVALPAIGLTLLQNRQVTGSWTTLPYLLSRYEYGVPTTFTFQPNPLPHRELTPEQQLEYRMQVSFHGHATDTFERYLQRLEYRVRFYRFFFFAPLYLAVLIFFTALRQWRFMWVLLSLIIFALGANFYPFFFPHYIAVVTCLFVLAGTIGLKRLSHLNIRGMPMGQEASAAILLICTAHFLFWYGMHLFDNQPFSIALRKYETWDWINHENPGGRNSIDRQLAQVPGRQLVFVRYWPQHIFQDEWVSNAADIDGARVVWARDAGAAENEKLRQYYPGRRVWLLEPDARPPKLSPFERPLEGGASP